MSGYGRIEDGDMVDSLNIWQIRLSGLWEMFNYYRDTGKRNFTFWVYMFCTYVLCFPLLIAVLLGTYFAEKDLEGMTLIFLNPLTAVQMAVKFYFCIWTGMETQARLFELVKRDFFHCVPPEKRKRADEILREGGRKGTMLANLGFLINCTTAWTWILLPIVRSEYFRNTTGITFFGKPKGTNKVLGYWWPGNIDDTPQNQIINSYEMIICTYVALIVSLIEVIIAVNVVMLTAQFKVLIFLMSDVKDGSSDSLLQYIKEHQRVLKFLSSVMVGQGRIKDEEMAGGLDVTYLKWTGLWEIFNHFRETGERNLTFKLMLYWTISLVSPFAVVSVLGPYFTQKDLEGMTLIFLNPLTTVQMLVKFFVCLWYGIETQSKILNLMKKQFFNCIPREKQGRANEILEKAGVKATRLAYIPFIVNGLTVLVWNFLPVLRSEYFRETLGITVFGKPKGHNKILGYWFPGNIDDTPYVQLIYVSEFVGCCWTGLMLTLVESLIAQNMVMLSGQFRVLMFLMSEVKTDHNELLAYIKAHQHIIKIGNELCDLYTFTITMQLATGLLILIIGIFNFFLQGSEDGDAVTMFKFMMYTLYTLIEVAIYCHIGSDLEVTSQEIAFAVYSSEWYKMCPERRKQVLMAMVRSRHTLALKAGHIYIVNHTILTDILQMAYSTSMMMSRMLKNKKMDE